MSVVDVNVGSAATTHHHKIPLQFKPSTLVFVGASPQKIIDGKNVELDTDKSPPTLIFSDNLRCTFTKPCGAVKLVSEWTGNSYCSSNFLHYQVGYRVAGVLQHE